MQILHLTIKREYFLAIYFGIKKIEYRDYKPYYHSRLNKNYTHLHLHNGYDSVVPGLIVEIKEIKVTDCYEIHLGNVISSENLHLIPDSALDMLL